MTSETRPSPLSAAMSALGAGISVVPPAEDGTKRPLGEWKHFQGDLPTRSQLIEWYGPRKGVGWVCGKVSNNLEVLDFDDRSVFGEFERAANDTGLGDLLQRVKDGYFELSPNGAHLAYRCAKIAGNQKLAPGHEKCRIETRGEGGYIIVAPSGREINRAGEYVLQSGSPIQIVEITENERQALHDLARTFTEYDPRKNEVALGTSINDGNRPGDRFNAQASWHDVLQGTGWQHVYSRGVTDYWRRPGKKHGISASTNNEESDLLYVFSTSTVFESERGYSKFAAWTILHHGGDFTAAAREAALIYDLDIDTSGFDWDTAINRKAPAEKKPNNDEFPKQLFDVPGALGWLMRWITDSGTRHQPILALAASLPAMGAILGRKLSGPTGLRPNVYTVGIGETGSGKDHARKKITELFNLIDYSQSVTRTVTSDSAILQRLMSSPDQIILWDEIGKSLRILLDPRQQDGNKSSLVACILEIFESSNSVYSKHFADARRGGVIINPNLNIYGTTVERTFYDALNTETLHDGFANRMLVFTSENPIPRKREPTSDKPPERLLKWFNDWRQATTTTGAMADTVPEPWPVEHTTSAKKRLREVDRWVDDKRIALLTDGRHHGLWARYAANVEKVATIRAAGQHETPGPITVTEEDVYWAGRLTGFVTNQLLDRSRKIVDTDDERLVQRVFDLILASDGQVTWGEVLRKCRIRTRQLTDIAATLQDRGLVSVTETNTSGPGRSGRRITAL